MTGMTVGSPPHVVGIAFVDLRSTRGMEPAHYISRVTAAPFWGRPEAPTEALPVGVLRGDLVGCLLPCGLSVPGWHEGQVQQRNRTVVSGNAIVSFDAAAGTAMKDHLLAIQFEERADRRHERPTSTGAITRVRPIDMARVQADWTVIAMAPARDGRSDKRPAMTAFELLGSVRFTGGFGATRSVWLALIPADPVGMVEIVRPTAEVHLWHVDNFLQGHECAGEASKRGSTSRRQVP
jgi:hypothetical protein